MTLVRETIEDAAIGVGMATTPDGLATIRKPGCAAVIWQRNPLQGFQDWLDSQPTEYLPQARVVLPVDAVHSALTEIVGRSGLPNSAERTLLIDDIAALADIFSAVLQSAYVRLHLKVITTDACQKFHIDGVTARLICTYRGVGTQYGISTDGEEPKRVFSTPTGSPIVLRGTLWPDLPKSGLLHRSPPIADTGKTRLVLVVDPVTEPSSEPASHLMH